MAALDLPWMNHMSPPRPQRAADTLDSSSGLRPPLTPSRNVSYDDATPLSAPNPTYATFSPTTLASSSAAKRRSTILVHQKSPLLLATPPQITRALAYSHPFLLPLNRLAGLLSWTTGDAWESFLLVAAWWAVVLYGSIIIRLAAPIVLVLALIAGMYGRRYSPLSSSGWSDDPANAGKPARAKAAKSRIANVDGAGFSSMGGSKGEADNARGGAGTAHARSVSEVTNTRHQKTLDEIVETLKEFTGRCNILLEPLLELTDFLSTQRTPTSATTRPALTTLFVRILLCTPVWCALTLPPLRIVTARRVVLVVGSVGLTWHARAMRVARTVIWRSSSVRRLAALVTGLQFEEPVKAQLFATAGSGLSGSTLVSKGATTGKSTPALTPQESELTKAIRRARGGHDAGVRFTFILYENQRRWVGLGWTTSLFAYERGAWTDEHNNAVPPRDEFELPGVEDGSNMRWRWVESSRWKVDGVPDESVKPDSKGENGHANANWDYDGPGGKNGWVYYDNKWQNGRRGQDGWGRWTRRRKWYRDAELVEVEPDDTASSHANTDPTPTPAPSLPPRLASPALSASTSSPTESQSMPSIAVVDDDRDKTKDGQGEESDTVSLLSTTSSTSRPAGGGGGRFRVPGLRRRVTTEATPAAVPAAIPKRARRTSEAESEDDVAGSLGTQLELEIQGAGKEGWGIGDEARMGLE